MRSGTISSAVRRAPRITSGHFHLRSFYSSLSGRHRRADEWKGRRESRVADRSLEKRFNTIIRSSRPALQIANSHRDTARQKRKYFIKFCWGVNCRILQVIWQDEIQDKLLFIKLMKVYVSRNYRAIDLAVLNATYDIDEIDQWRNVIAKY